MPEPATRTVVVWSPDWPVTAAVLAGEVTERSGPVAVLSANRVVACSAPARADGVRRGLRSREAQSRCPELVVLPHDPDRDARMFEPVAAAVETCAPGVDVLRPGLVAVGARGPARYYGGDSAVAARLVEAVIDAVGVPVRAGVADGVLAATLAAQSDFGAHRAEPVIVPVGASPGYLAEHPVGTLDRPELVDLLRRLGVRTLGAFAALAARDVVDRFGADGAAAHRLARGLDLHPLAARPPAPDTIVRTAFEPPVRRVDTAAFAARALAVAFHEGLTNRGLGCLRLGIVARTTDGEELTRSWRHDGALSASAVADRVRWQLDGWLTARRTPDPDAGADPDVGIASLALVPDQVVPYSGQQLGLWGGTGEADERADVALTRVQGLLGPAAVVTPVPDGGRDPGERVHLVPWGDPREPVRIPPRGAADPRDAVPPWPGALPAPYPATVLPVPIAVSVADCDGRPVGVTGRYAVTAAPAYLCPTDSADPAGANPAGANPAGAGGDTGAGPAGVDSGGAGGSGRVRCTAVRGRDRIARWTGPWPVDERWWDPAGARRRARFQVVTADGIGRLLVLEGGRWWIEAVYD